MAAGQDPNLPEDELMAPRRGLYAQFLKFSTYGIVGVALILIGMAVFLL